MKHPRFSLLKARDGWRWRLVAANGRIIATGEAHTRKRDAQRAIVTVTETVERIGHRTMIDRIKAGAP